MGRKRTRHKSEPAKNMPEKDDSVAAQGYQSEPEPAKKAPEKDTQECLPEPEPAKVIQEPTMEVPESTMEVPEPTVEAFEPTMEEPEPAKNVIEPVREAPEKDGLAQGYESEPEWKTGGESLYAPSMYG